MLPQVLAIIRDVDFVAKEIVYHAICRQNTRLEQIKLKVVR